RRRAGRGGAGGQRDRRSARHRAARHARRSAVAVLFLSHGHADPAFQGTGPHSPRRKAQPRHRSRRVERGRRAVPAPVRARGRPRHAAVAQPLPVHRHAPRALFRPHPRRISRHHRRTRRIAFSGWRGRALLRHGLPGSELFQHHQRQPVHRRSDAQAPGLYRDAARFGAQRDQPAPPFGPRRDAHAGRRRLCQRRLFRHLRWRPDDDRAHRPGEID
ncbi:hypothetical protein OY671_009294, partial [Metschnikowia pulcherrima]